MFLNRSFFKDDVDKMTTSTGDASRELHQPSASTVRNDSKWTDWSNSWDWRESSWQDVWWWWKLKDFNELWKNSMGKKTNEFGFEKNQMHLDLLKTLSFVRWEVLILFLVHIILYRIFFLSAWKTTTFRKPSNTGWFGPFEDSGKRWREDWDWQWEDTGRKDEWVQGGWVKLWLERYTPAKTHHFLDYKGTISVGNTSSNQWFSGEIWVFRGAPICGRIFYQKWGWKSSSQWCLFCGFWYISSLEQWTSPGCLGSVGDCTTQLCGD